MAIYKIWRFQRSSRLLSELIGVLAAWSLSTLAGCILIFGNWTPPALASNRDPNIDVRVTRYASQETDPFKINGEVVGSDSGYRDVLRRYPDVRACLSRQEQSLDRPDIKNFDWKGLSGQPSHNVCLFRVFASLRDISQITAWSRSQGFSLLSKRRQTYRATDEENGRAGVWVLTFKTSNENYRRLSGAIWNPFIKYFVYSITYSLAIDDNGMIYWTNFSLTSE